MGNGQADGEAEETLDMDVEVYDDNGLDEDGQEEEEEDGSNHSQPLLFYICETTGLSIYNEHLTEVAARVVGVPLSKSASFPIPVWSTPHGTSLRKVNVSTEIQAGTVLIQVLTNSQCQTNMADDINRTPDLSPYNSTSGSP